MMISRNDILIEACDKCYKEMFKWAQPSINIDELIKSGYKDNDEHPLYSLHYLSPENFKYIKDKYMSAYGIVDNWKDTFELIYQQLNDGGIERYYTKEGNKDFREFSPLKKCLKNPEDFDIVIDYLKKIQNFFKGSAYETNSFNMSICLGCSPTSCNEKVEEYWRNNGRPDFTIKDFDIEDVIYGDEYIDITEDEFIKTLK